MQAQPKYRLELYAHLGNVETMADQTAVHRKKFEFALSIFRKVVNSLDEMAITDSPKVEQITDEVLPYFHEILETLSQNVIQTWTLPTIENPPCFILDQLISLFSRFKKTLEKFDSNLSKIIDTEAEEWKEYNTLDLRAISASFTQYLKTPGIKNTIFQKVKHRLQTIDDFLAENATDSLAPRVFSPIPVHYQSWRVDYDDFTEIKEIGRGVSAHVFRGLDKRTNEEVAIKKFTFQKLNSSRFQSYQREVAVLATAQHPALLRLIGATDKTPFCIITEWMNGGTLYQAIHKPGFFSATERTIAAFDIARGMKFLHARKIVHRDLKTLNVLLDDNKRVKICDFGFSRFAENDTLMTSNIGTPHWMAPEVLKRGSHYTSKVDVYAYGIVLWELATSDTPYPGYDSQKIIQEVLHNDLRPPLPADINPQVKDMISLCWARNPNARPSFDEIVEAFTKNGLMFDNSDANEVDKYIDASATEGEQLSTELAKLFKSFMDGNKSISDLLSTISGTGIPHNVIEAAWTSIEKFVPNEQEAIDYTRVLSYFLKTSKLGQVSERLRKMPSGFIPLDVITKFVSELPTGSPDTDRNICIAACKNKAADLCSLYSTAPTDVALSLEVCATNGVDYQLRVIVVDRSVQSLSAKNLSLAAAALRCLIALGEAKRIPVQFLEKCFTNGEPFESLAFTACSALGDSGSRVSDSIIEKQLPNVDNDPRSALLIVSSCKNKEAASFVVDHLQVMEGTENIARILLSAYVHEDLREKVRSLASSINFNESLSSLIKSALLL